MPITTGLNIQALKENEFRELDYQVMKLAFAIHNDLGRLHDEKIYQTELAHRCRQAGVGSVQTEVPITVSYDSFRKLYEVDLLINQRALYELKAVTALSGEHRKQSLNYLLLLALFHGKLLNFRTASLQHSFISTTLTPQERRRLDIHAASWEDLDPDSVWLREILVALLRDWGGFLDLELFYEAIQYFRGGEQNVVRRIEVQHDARPLGTQRAHLLNDRVAFKLTALTDNENHFEQHLRRFLNHTALGAIQWVNLNHHDVTFTTIKR